MPARRTPSPDSRPPVLLQEKIVVALLAILLIYLPWAIGTVHVWSQQIACGIAAAALLVALWPRLSVPSALVLLRNWPIGGPGSPPAIIRLLRFPVFWAGLALLFYILIQAVNVSWVFTTDGEQWWMESREHVAWLPSGMRTPMEMTSPWRYMINLGGALMMVCALWVGVERRTSLRFLFWVLSLNAVALAGFGLVQYFSEAREMFWSLSVRNTFFSTFIYPNHAAGYFNLVLGVMAGFAFYLFRRSSRLGKGSSPGLLFILFIPAVLFCIYLTRSRTGIALAAILFFAIVIYLIWYLARRSSGGIIAPAFLIAGLMTVVGFLTWDAFNTDATIQKFQRLQRADTMAEVLGGRQSVYEATYEMFKDKWVYGWGAGSFRFYFPVYQQHYPEIWEGRGGLRIFWETAHSDLLQWPAEFGVVGIGLMLFILGWFLWMIGRSGFRHEPISFFCILGCLLVLAHGALDFPFRSGAILYTFCFVWAIAARQAVLAHRRSD